MTVFVYLNDLPDNDGGETQFPELGIQIVPRRGCAVMWSNVLEPGVADQRMVHAGLPPQTAIKYGVNCFFHEKPVRHWDAVKDDTPQDEDDRMPVNKEHHGWHTLDPNEFGKAGEANQLCAFTVLEDPKLTLLPQAVSPGEAVELRKIADHGIGSINEAILNQVQLRLAAIAGLSLAHIRTFRVAKCGPTDVPDGQILAWDKGNAIVPVEQGYRERFGHRTIFVFLNDLGEGGGGELRFPRLATEVRPREGCAVSWSTTDMAGADNFCTVHQGRPPKNGTRYGLTCTFHL